MQSNPLSVPQFLLEITKYLLTSAFSILVFWATTKLTKRYNKQKDETDIGTNIAQKRKIEAETVKIEIESSESAYEIVLRSLRKVEEINTKYLNSQDELKKAKEELRRMKAKETLATFLVNDSTNKIEDKTNGD